MDGAKVSQEAYQGPSPVLLLPIYHMAFGGKSWGKSKWEFGEKCPLLRTGES
jgi:hypothetical protein